MSTWTEELKAKVIQQYEDANPTPETSVEIVKKIAEDIGESANGVRMILTQAKVYVKKDAAATSTASTTGTKPAAKTDGTKRVSKESQIAELKAAIVALEGPIDDDILSKLTGKAAAYFTSILKK